MPIEREGQGSVEEQEPFGTDEEVPMRPHLRDDARIVLAMIGLAGVGFAEVLPNGQPANVSADIGFIGLLTAAVFIMMSSRCTAQKDLKSIIRSGAVTWRWTIFGIGAAGLLIAQTWFRAGTLIADGDIAPPIGTAWISRIFDSYGWSGFNLGGPATNQGRLPFGVLDELVHLAGGSGALAQRIWLSLLISGIMVAASGLARSLAMSPLSGLVVGFAFFFNPMTLSQIQYNDVYLVAMVLVAALPAMVVSYGHGATRSWHLNLTFIISAPFIGFIDANPPLVGMLLLTLLATPLLVWARFDRAEAVRSFRGLLIAGALAGAASSYWLIPSLMATSSVASGSLSKLSAWAFTESRSTLANGFWLNTTWGWNYSEYYPFAHYFDQFPLLLIRPLIPLLAFLGLTYRPPLAQPDLHSRSLRLTGLLSFLVLGLILLSNGTLAPGSLLFDPLYQLPYGWLLREPGRFLLVAALGYALLVGLLVDRTKIRVRALAHSRLSRSISKLLLRTNVWTALGAMSVALVSAFPLWTGSVVLGPHSGFPSQHVAVPKYWENTAAFMNSPKSPHGSLLVLPPDDFYAMPYTWYYGNDGFIPDLFEHHIVVPTGQSYYKVPIELLNAVKLEASALVNHQWKEASRLLIAIGTPIILLRGDINAGFPGRTIVSPATLLTALEHDPKMHLLRRFGQLSLFELNSGDRLIYTGFATTESATPDLSALALLPPRTALVTSPPQVGHEIVIPLPPLSKWKTESSGLTTHFTPPSLNRWTFSLAFTNSRLEARRHMISISHPNRSDQSIRIVRALGPSLLSNGDFRAGGWGAVGNCNSYLPVKSKSELGGQVIARQGPNGSSILSLHASVDAACESAPLKWHGGEIFLRYSSRSISGSSPRICLWEVPNNQCAKTSVSTSSMSSAWKTETFLVQPNVGTQTLSLVVYADAPGDGTETISQYANFIVRSITPSPQAFLVGLPRQTAPESRLIVGSDGYSAMLSGPPGDNHVLVNGLHNGWLVVHSSRDQPGSPGFSKTPTIAINVIWFAGVMLLLAAAVTWGDRRRLHRATRDAVDGV